MRRSLVHLESHGTTVSGSPEHVDVARADFAARYHLRLAEFLSPGLLGRVMTLLDRESSAFRPRGHDSIGSELCLLPGSATALLHFVNNCPTLFRLIEAITGCPTIGSFNGRVYRMNLQAGHYDSWHADLTEGRLIALSVNLSTEPFEGGSLEIRPVERPHEVVEVSNPVPGDAVLFRIDPELEHRVTPVSGSTYRTAFAGWFCADQPSSYWTEVRKRAPASSPGGTP